MTPLDPVLKKLRTAVYPAIEGYWRADAAVAEFLNSSMPEVGQLSGPCGPAALAALFGGKIAQATPTMIDKPWINRRDMEGRLKAIGVAFEKLHRRMPAQGLALLEPVIVGGGRNFRGSFLRHTHWVAVVDDFIFDVNWPSWIPSRHWRSLVGVALAEARGAQDWRPVTSFEIRPNLCSRQK